MESVVSSVKSPSMHNIMVLNITINSKVFSKIGPFRKRLMYLCSILN